MIKHQVTRYTIPSSRVTSPVTLAVVTDLHNGNVDDILPDILGTDAVLLVGDIVNRHHRGMGNTVSFMLALENRPVFFSRGNHELKSPEGEPAMALCRRLGFHMVDNTVEHFGELAIAGQPAEWTFPEGGIAEKLSSQNGFRLLLCHHPEYYDKLVHGRDIDLCVAGHAHGGQIQIAGHGLYAPGQGIFPKYTNGFYDNGKLLVSRGIHNTAPFPRFGNPCELILLTIKPSKGASSD